MSPKVDSTNKTAIASSQSRKTTIRFGRYVWGLLLVLLLVVHEWLGDLNLLRGYPFNAANSYIKSHSGRRSNTHEHVVFIGDALLRNAYLEWVDQIHYQRGDNSWAPDNLLMDDSEESNSSWTESFLYTIDHFQGYMSCDCRRFQRSWVVGLNHHVENRYYSHGSVTATYLQGYGDYATHGRYEPHTLPEAQPTIDPESANDEKKLVWEYRGLDWDQLILHYVSKLTPKPTAIVMNAGTMWPNYDISLNMGRILQAAKRVVGEEGTVIWRETASPRIENSTTAYEGPSPADQAARDWSYRIAGVLYQTYPSGIGNSSEDHSHLGGSRFYRHWNMDLNRALWDRPQVQHMAFIVVGAVRSLPQTHHTMMQNLVRRACPPYWCVAHLILHLSGADNRPNRDNPDPRGVAIRPSGHENHTTYFQHPDQYDWPHDYLCIHYVDESYEIGSPEEQAAMDRYEREYIQEEVASMTQTATDDSARQRHDLLRRFHVIRFGDPRRYSMWFARAWAWRYVKKLKVSFDYYLFTRPDLLWYLPFPTVNVFRDFAKTDQDIWVHDRYYNDVPDTLALLPTQSVAERYLSLRYLLHPRVGCLGGPDFDRAVVAARLRRVNITVNETDWCPEEIDGWSEMILRHKIEYAQLHKRWFPAGVTIWRPPDHVDGEKHGALLCEPVHVTFVIPWVRFTKTNLPYWGCLFAEYALRNDWRVGTGPGLTTSAHGGVVPVYCFRWRSRDRVSLSSCLSRLENGDDTIAWVSEPCQDPIPAGQIYSKIPGDEHHWLGIDVKTGGHVVHFALPDLDRTMWFPEPIHLYGALTLVEAAT